jgi:hypothetical protein
MECRPTTAGGKIVKPIVFEWFFEDLIVPGDFAAAKDAYDTAVKFAVVCEGMTEAEAEALTNRNMYYYSGYAERWREGWLAWMTV